MSLSSSDELDDAEVRVASIHPSPAHSAAESSSSASSRAPSAALSSQLQLREDSGNSAGRAHLSPSLQLSALETGAGSSLEFSRSDASSPLSSIHSGRSSALDSGATRPSPQLLYAINHTSPTREQQTQQHTQAVGGATSAGSSSRGNSAAGRTGSQITPPPNVAGRMPPSFALERPALPVAVPSPAVAAPSSASKSSSSGFAPPTFTATSRFNLQQHQLQHQQSHSPLSSGPSTPTSGPLIPQATRGRSWSMGPLPSVHRSPAGSHAIAAAAAAAYANLTPPIGAGAYARRQILMRNFEGRSALAGGVSGSGDPHNEEEAEDELLLGASASLRALRNRAHSQPGTQPIPMDMSGLEPLAWSSKGSRLVIYCASGILFLLIFCFFIVVALRMAAHTKYNNHLCVVRDQERQAARGGPAAGTTAAFEAEAKSYEDSVAWAPNYDASSWDRAAFLTSLKSKWAADQSEEAALSAKAQTARASAILDAGSWLPHLRLHHLKVVGTHNSYHQPSSLPLSMHQYAHASLPVQLANYRRGVRQLELDLHIIPNQQRPKRDARVGTGGSSDRSGSTAGFVVYHLQWLDDRTSCYCLSECLDLISLWSARHPVHFPLYISFEIKSRIWEDVDTGLRGVTCQDLEDVEAEIAQVFPREKMVTPWEIRGGRHARPEKKDNAGRVVQTAQSEVQPQFATVREALQAAADIEARYAASLTASLTADPSFKPVPADYPSMDYGWPRLVDSLGKVVLVWLDDMHNLADQLDCMQESAPAATATIEPKGNKKADSTSNNPSAATPLALEVTSSSAVAYNPGWFHSPSRLLFIAQNSMDAPYASFVTAKHPSAAMLAGLVRAALTRGLMVRTMTDESVNALPDPGRFAAALRSGAQILSTDFEECVERSEFHQSEPNLDGHEETQPQGITGAAEATELPPNTAAASRSPKMLFDTHIHEDAHEPHVMAVPSLLPSSPLALSASRNSSSTLYCEHLPSEWPFECAQLAAPFFCEAALYALRLQRDFAEASAAKGAKP